MFSKSAQYYDEIYASIDKDYVAEASKAHTFIQKYKKTKGSHLLDVACGTGTHASLLSKYYRVEGLDLGDETVQIRVLAAVMVAIKHALTGTAESLTVDDVAEQATPPAILDHNRVDLPR